MISREKSIFSHIEEDLSAHKSEHFLIPSTEAHPS
jgi:hypothetical protein